MPRQSQRDCQSISDKTERPPAVIDHNVRSTPAGAVPPAPLGKTIIPSWDARQGAMLAQRWPLSNAYSRGAATYGLANAWMKSAHGKEAESHESHKHQELCNKKRGLRLRRRQ
jgi:hypothetical protein